MWGVPLTSHTCLPSVLPATTWHFPCLRTCSYCIHVRSLHPHSSSEKGTIWHPIFRLEHLDARPTPEAKSQISRGSLPEFSLCSSGCPFLILTTSFVLAHSKTVQPFPLHRWRQRHTVAGAVCQKSYNTAQVAWQSGQLLLLYSLLPLHGKKINNLWAGHSGSQGSRLSAGEVGSWGEEGARQQEWQAALHGQPGQCGQAPTGWPTVTICRQCLGTWGLQATYHQVLDKLELLGSWEIKADANSREVLGRVFFWASISERA